jgi:hypothetical protein
MTKSHLPSVAQRATHMAFRGNVQPDCARLDHDGVLARLEVELRQLSGDARVSGSGVGDDSTAPHRTAPHRTAPHRTAPHRGNMMDAAPVY